MRDNPIYPLVIEAVKEYHKLLKLYGERVKNLLDSFPALTPYNEATVRKYLFSMVDKLEKETQSFFVEKIYDAIKKTIDTYNDIHIQNGFPGLDFMQVMELESRLLKQITLSKYKYRTLDQRLTVAFNRLRENISQVFSNPYFPLLPWFKAVQIIISHIRGKQPMPGGTAFRWNSRLLISEMFRAYQFAAREVLGELGIEKVMWKNTKRHKIPNVTDKYDGMIFTPKQLPDYPYPCNDSYFIPIYEN